MKMRRSWVLAAVSLAAVAMQAQGATLTLSGPECTLPTSTMIPDRLGVCRAPEDSHVGKAGRGAPHRVDPARVPRPHDHLVPWHAGTGTVAFIRWPARS